MSIHFGLKQLLVNSVILSSTSASTSTSTGTLQVGGGIGVAGNSYFGGVISFANATASTSTSTGAIVCSGGIGVAGNSYFGGTVTASGGANFDRIDPISNALNIGSPESPFRTFNTYYKFFNRADNMALPLSASLLSAFGALASMDVYGTTGHQIIGDHTFLTHTINCASPTSINTYATVVITGAPQAGTNATITNLYGLYVDTARSRFGGQVLVTNTTTSTSATTGAFQCSGGIGVAGASYFNSSVTIGGTNPSGANVPLYIGNTNTGNLGTFTYYAYTSTGTAGVITNSALNAGSVSLQTTGRILSGGEVDVISDQRIKCNINAMQPQATLEQLMDLQPRTYAYIDKLRHGSKITAGFIGQEIEKVFPNMVQTETQFIPNIMKNTTATNISKTASQIKIRLDASNLDLVVGKTYQIHDVLDNTMNMEYVEPDVFIGECVDGDWNPTNSELFIYGELVDDFKVVNYQGLVVHLTAAVQQLYQEIKTLKAR